MAVAGQESDRIGATLTAARPQALGALVRHFRDIDRAEDAFQTACLRALSHWPKKGRPRDPAAWLILVGRNAAIDALRRDDRLLPPEAGPFPTAPGESEAAALERMEAEDYRDDILRLLFICSHPALPVGDQLILALKIVAGLSVREVARAFLVAPKAMEQRITRAKRKVTAAGIDFETPGAAERGQRLAAVAAMLYLLFNEGYSSAGGDAHIRAGLCAESIRLQRLLLRLFPGQTEVMGLLALSLLQHARYQARLDEAGQIVLLEAQDRGLWDRVLIAEAGALLDKALRRGQPGPYQIQAAIAGVHCAARRPEDTDWAEIERLYRALEQAQPSPVVTLNRAVALSKLEGPEAALDLIAPLAARLDGYLYFHGLRAALLEDLGKAAPAAAAYARALELCNTPAETAHLGDRLVALRKKFPDLSD